MIVVVAGATAAIVALTVGYRWLFVLAYLLRGDRLRSPSQAASAARFAVLMPAHQEEAILGDALASLARVEYPPALVETIVIADNCTDRTAEVARAAGVRVLERRDPEAPGKGQALSWALSQIDLARYDAVAVVDADNRVTPGFFRVMSQWLANGARVLQGYDGTANPDETPLTRLMAVTIAMKNLLYNGGRSALGLSPLLMGTGMVFASDLLRSRGWAAGSIGEDLEESFALIEARERIRFVPDAEVQAQEAASLRQAYAQRQRWASSRAALWGVAARAVARGVRTRNVALVDAGLNLLLPTYSMSANLTLVALFLGRLAWGESALPLVIAVACVGLQAAEFGLGLRLVRADVRTVGSIALAPIFLVWKAGIDLLATLGFRRRRWVRTERHRGL